ncbi:MAG TPA: carbohydrate ABC transporter permease, partial [Candidatus Blautia merdavium]|nr:carbohydrate ABC transporter permease [Candidatus Blautia merdavium]
QNQASIPGQGRIKSKKKSEKIGKIITYILLISLSVIFMIPFVWLLSSSLKSNADIFAMPPKWIPDPIEFSNYVEVFRQVPFFRFLANTLKIAVPVLVANVFVSAMVGYAFARFRAPGKNVLFMLLLSTMMLPSQVTMIPLFIMFKEVGWVDTLLPMIVPVFFGGSALYVFLFRQYYATFSASLGEAARIDGAGYFKTFTHVYLPMSKPILITVGIFSFMGSWNDFMGPLIYLNDMNNFTLAIGLNMFKTQYIQNWNYTMAYNVMIVAPLIILFFVAQKSFIQGIVITGTK